MASVLLQSPMGPGFESQVPQNIYLIFLQALSCNAQNMVHHMPQRSRRQMASRPDLVDRNEGLPYTQVNNHALDQAKSNRPGSFGLRISNNTPL